MRSLTLCCPSKNCHITPLWVGKKQVHCESQCIQPRTREPVSSACWIPCDFMTSLRPSRRVSNPMRAPFISHHFGDPSPVPNSGTRRVFEQTTGDDCMIVSRVSFSISGPFNLSNFARPLVTRPQLVFAQGNSQSLNVFSNSQSFNKDFGTPKSV